MEDISNKNIQSIRYYKCGHCTNRLGFAYKGESFSKSTFPSGVFLIEHKIEGYILFDTGYSQDISQSGFIGWLYNKFNPVSISNDDEIISQLQKDGISPDDISYVILSHLHPDHIGGCKFFPNAKFLLSLECQNNLSNHSINDLIIDSLIPDWLKLQIVTVNEHAFETTLVDGFKAYDIFGDKSIFLLELPGHAKGHIGALIPNTLLLAGDSCWSNHLVTKAKSSRLTLRYINSNQSEYLTTLNSLEQMRNRGLRLCFSHEHYDEKILFNG